MPTLKDLQANVASAQTAYQSALSDQSAKLIDMQNQYAEFKSCKYKWGLPAIGVQLDVNGCDSGVIASQHPGCGSKSTCENRVKNYNGAVVAYNNASATVAAAKTSLDAAQAALDNFVKTDPTALQQESQREMWKTIGIVSIVVVVIAAAVWGIIYWVRKSKAS